MAKLYVILIGLLFTFHSLGTAQNKARSLWLSVDTPIALRLTGTLNSDSSKPQIASLATTDDITIDDLVVVPKGSRVLHNVAVGDAHRFNRPGEVQLIVEGVYALDGQLVPLSGKQHRVGALPCLERDCLFLPLLFWKKGERPSLPAEMLIAARVSKSTFFDRSLMEQLTKELSQRSATSLSAREAKLHLYSASSDGAGSVRLRLDGKPIGSLPVGEYGCFSLSPGLHVIETNNDDLKIDAISGGEYYVEVLAGRAALVQTEGYQIAGQSLQPAGRKTLRDQTPCF